MAELAGKSVQLKMSGTALTLTTEATTAAVDDKTYQITNAVKRVIDWETVPTVYDGGVETVEAYTIDYLSGRIVFEDADAGRTITISGKYLPMTVIGFAKSYSRNDSATLLDKTVFGDTHIKRTSGLKSSSGTLTQIDIETDDYLVILRSGKPIVIEDIAIIGVEPSRVLAFINQSELSGNVDALQENPITWTSTDKFLRLGV